MAGVKKKEKAQTYSPGAKYFATTGINFDDLPARVEAGEPLPENVSSEQVKDLLEIGAIEEK